MNLKDYVKNIISEELNLMGKTVHIVSTTDDDASKVYMGKKKQLVEKFKGSCTIHEISWMQEADKRYYLDELQQKCDIEKEGIIVQFPVSSKLVEEWVYRNLKPELDLDGLSDASVASLQRFKQHKTGYCGMDYDCYVPATALGVYTIISNLTSAEKKKVSILGRSMLVGTPLKKMLLDDGRFDVEILDSRTKRISFDADFIVLARGVGLSISEIDALHRTISTGKKPVLIDVSIMRKEDGKISGEIPREMYEFLEKSGVHFTPVPGGAGLLTTHFLLKQFSEGEISQ